MDLNIPMDIDMDGHGYSEGVVKFTEDRRCVGTQTDKEFSFSCSDKNDGPEFENKENFLWFICPNCCRAFSKHESKLIAHKQKIHGISSQNRTAFIMSLADVSPALVLQPSGATRSSSSFIHKNANLIKRKRKRNGTAAKPRSLLCPVVKMEEGEASTAAPMEVTLTNSLVDGDNDTILPVKEEPVDEPTDIEHSDYFAVAGGDDDCHLSPTSDTIDNEDNDRKSTSEFGDEGNISSSSASSSAKIRKRKRRKPKRRRSELPKCKFCPKRFDNPIALASHEDLCTKVDRYCCELCSATLKTQYILNGHMRIVHGTPTFTCETCQKAFHTEKRLRDHMNFHTSTKPYVCQEPHCGRRYSTNYAFKQHGQDHRKRRNSAMAGSSWSDEKEERITNAGTEDKEKAGADVSYGQRPFLCSACGKTFEKGSGLKLHFKNIHLKQKVLKHTCDICGYKTSSPALLATHKIKHSTERPFTCDVCGKCFKSVFCLRTHMKGHTGARKRHKCSKCDKAFTLADVLTAHELKEHSEGEPIYAFSCKYCDKKFLIERYLVHHEARHIPAARKHVCDICGMKFIEAKRLRGHLAVHKRGGITRKKVPVLQQVAPTDDVHPIPSLKHNRTTVKWN